MGNVSSVVLAVPFDPPAAVVAALPDLGFVPADGYLNRPELTVWLMLDHKLNYYEHQKFGIDGLRELVLALPWQLEKRDPGLDLQVLWTDGYTNEDDGWGGRSAPYAWNHETWEVRA